MSRPSQLEIWRYEMPRMAVAHPFLMHGLLAASALHLSSVIPSRSKIAIALEEEQLALPSFWSLPASNNPESSHAVFAFSGVVITYVPATTFVDKMITGHIPSRYDPHPHLAFPMRGVLSLLQHNWMALELGPFGPLLDNKIEIETSDNANDDELLKLQVLFAPSAVTSTSPSELNACVKAYSELRRAFALPFIKRRSWLDTKVAVYVWPGVVSEELITLLSKRKPEGLIFFSILLHLVETCGFLLVFQRHQSGAAQSDRR